MQVTCQRCGARYEFAADSIPAGGYEARCRHCSHDFFVAPPSSAGGAAANRPAPTPSKRPSGLERLFTGDLHAGDGDAAAQPLFLPDEPQWSTGASDEAAGGGAKETERSPPAPVSTRRATVVRTLEVEPDQRQAPGSADRAAGPAPSGPSFLTDDEPAPRGDAPPRSAGPAHAAAAYAARRRDLHREGMAEAAADPRPTRPRARIFVGVAASLLVLLGVVVGVIQSKTLHAPTQVTPPVHVISDPPAAAKQAFSDGMQALEVDTKTSLAAALGHFSRALELDREYTDAWAAFGLAAWLGGIDARHNTKRADLALQKAVGRLTAAAKAQGQEASAVHLAQGDEQQSATDAALALAASSLRLRGAISDLESLHERERSEDNDAWAEAQLAGAALLYAQQLSVQSPLLATVVALWHSDADDGAELVAKQLKVAEHLIGQQFPPERRSWLGPAEPGEDAAAPPKSAPWAAWRLLARGRLAAAQARRAGANEQARSAATASAIAAFEAALRLQPGLRRAELELAEVHHVAGERDQAELIAKRLLARTPGHERAQMLLADLAAAP